MKHNLILAALIGATVAGLPMQATQPAFAATNEATRKPDLADRVQGVYKGAVTSDSRGSSRNDITVTVTRVGHNVVEIACDYDRIPTVRIPIQSASTAIIAVKNAGDFVMDLERDPNRLDLYIDGAALLVRR